MSSKITGCRSIEIRALRSNEKIKDACHSISETIAMDQPSAGECYYQLPRSNPSNLIQDSPACQEYLTESPIKNIHVVEYDNIDYDSNGSGESPERKRQSTLRKARKHARLMSNANSGETSPHKNLNDLTELENLNEMELRNPNVDSPFSRGRFSEFSDIDDTKHSPLLPPHNKLGLESKEDLTETPKLNSERR